ncbi:MAG TPA: rhodanese-like domain-containing protein, partial [Methanomassiliicoccales archaeon]|nr:rhodanese-like domain-containing protein [Methanomassiliicoccales archaeon]
KLDRQGFIELKSAQEMEISPIFKRMEAVNLEGAKVIGRVPAPAPLAAKEVKHALVKGSCLLDLRSPAAFSAAHIPGSINLQTEFLPIYAPYVMPWERPAVLIADNMVDVDRAVTHLFRIGYDDAARYMRGGMDMWIKGGNEIVTTGSISARELKERMMGGEDMLLLDVRDMKERSKGTIEDAGAVHLGELSARSSSLPKNRTIVTFCGSGFRGSCAASILSRNGFTKLYNLMGGFSAWKNAGFPVAKWRGPTGPITI